MIILVVSGLKKTRFVCLLNLFGGRRRRGSVIYGFGLPLNGGLMVVLVMSFSHMVNMVLVLCEVGPILKNGYEI